MIIRRVLLVQLCVLPFLFVALLVLGGTYAITNGVGDAAGATIVWRVAMFTLMLNVIDLALMIPTLAMFCLSESRTEPLPKGKRSQSLTSRSGKASDVDEVSF